MTKILLPQIDCDTASKFLEALSPNGDQFRQSHLNETWLFRGQGNEFPLVPSLFRNKKLEEFTHRDIASYKERTLAERDILVQFFDIADRRGLILPDDSQDIRALLQTLNSKRGEMFIGEDNEWQPAKSVFSLAALAQHYGLPTRLLDWTRQAFVAAYFAAEDAHNSNLSGRMVVWAFYFPLFGKHDVVETIDDPIRIVTAPSATNTNLRAQQGVFSCVHPFYSKEAEQDYKPLEQLLAEMETSDFQRPGREFKLRKFTLPTSESLRLLHMLAKMDITPSAIYPGYRSIGEDLKWQKLFEKLSI